jgi:hypothetical protein
MIDFIQGRVSNKVLCIVILGAFLLSACTTGGVPVREPDASEVTPDSSFVETDPSPTIRPDLHATDPKEVVLASGKLQLIEFFAFW